MRTRIESRASAEGRGVTQESKIPRKTDKMQGFTPWSRFFRFTQEKEGKENFK
jgi:hypothetical protein